MQAGDEYSIRFVRPAFGLAGFGFEFGDGFDGVDGNGNSRSSTRVRGWRNGARKGAIGFLSKRAETALMALVSKASYGR